MAIRAIARTATKPGGYPGRANAAPIYCDSDDNTLKIIPGGSGSTTEKFIPLSDVANNGGTAVTKTAASALAQSDNNKVVYLNSATEFATTLPAPFAGGHFVFIVVAAPSGASYTVVGASGTPIHGMVLSKDLNGATDSGATAGTGVLTLTFVDGKAQKGDNAEFWSDGTDWFVVARTGGNFDAITLS